MSQGARTRNFMTQPHSSLITPREASPAFRIGEHYSSNPERWVGYGLALVYAQWAGGATHREAWLRWRKPQYRTLRAAPAPARWPDGAWLSG